MVIKSEPSNIFTASVL
jgi:hypothetical protein